MKPASDISLQGLRLLIVEDDPLSSTLLSRILTKYGAIVDTASNGDEALARIRRKPLLGYCHRYLYAGHGRP